MLEGHRNTHGEGQSHSSSHKQGNSSMSSSIYQMRKEEIQRVHAALTERENPLSKEEAHFADMCCHKLGIEYQDKTL